MYDPCEFIREFNTYTPLERAALELGEADSSLLAEQLGIKDYQLDQNSRRTLSKEYYFPAGTGITYSRHPRFVDCPVHRHDFFELTYVWQGSVWQTVNTSRINIKEGSLLLLDTNVRHSLERVDKDTFVINIMMTKEYFHEKLMKQFSCSNRITEFIFSALYRHSLSGNFHFSPNYFSRLLKKYTGKTFITVILELKLERAAMLLKNTTLPVSKAAAASGFQNMNYFYKLFREKYGCTPKQFRSDHASPMLSM